MYSHLAVLNPLYGGVGPYGGSVGFRRSHCRFSAGIFNIVNRQETLTASGGTTGEIIDDIDKRYPGFKKECIDPQGKPYGFQEIYLN